MFDILDHCDSLPQATFAPGETLLREGEAGGRLFILIDGTVLVTKNNVHVAKVADRGALFGEMAVLLGLPVSATVTALTTVQVRVCTDPLTFIRTRPEVALQTARLLAARLHNATSYLADLKLQFHDRNDHFGMMDRILDAMVEQHPGVQRKSGHAPDDPRL